MNGDGIECPRVLRAARRGGGRPGVYLAPSEREREAMRRIIALLLRAGAGAKRRAVREAAEIGFELVPAREIEGVVVVRERVDRRRGGGAFLIRGSSESSLVVQAPHTFTDEGTLPLACDFFRHARARGLFVDTVHRSRGAAADAMGHHASDVAHALGSTFQAATEGLLRVLPRARVIQLHGFAARDAGTRVVVSTGHPRGAAYLDLAAARLSAILGHGVVRYPEEIGELGGTTNVQGRSVRRAGGRFLHLELVAAVRRELLKQERLRHELFEALVEAVGAA